MSSWVRKQDNALFETIELIVSGVLPILLIVGGTLGNILSVAILLKKQNRQTSTNIYLIFLCIVDMLSLYQWNLAYLLYEFTNGRLQITNQSLFLCKWHLLLAFYTLHTSAMFLTLVALDRSCLLCSLWYKRRIARARLALVFCITILLLLFALDGFLFGLGVEYSIYDNATASTITLVGCYYSTNAQLNDFFANQYTWVHAVVMYIVPFTVMFVCTVMTVRKLAVSPTVDNQQLANSAQRNRRISIMLLLMCASYAVLTLPNRLCFSVCANALNVFFLYLSVYGFRRDVLQLVKACYRRVACRVFPKQSIVGSRVGPAARTLAHEQTTV